MIRGNFVAALAAIIFIGQKAEACGSNDVTGLTVGNLSPASPLTWNPMPGGAAVTSDFTFSLARQGNTRSVRVIFRDANTGSPLRIGASGPIYDITPVGSGTSVAFQAGTAANASNGFLIDMSTMGTKTATFRLTLPFNSAGEDFVGGANFSEQITYSVQCYNNSNATIGTGISGNAINPTVTIPKLVTASIAGQTDIDFGSFTSTTPAPLNISVKSTSSVNVKVYSSNGLTMVRKTAVAPYPDNETIEYAMSLNGTPVSGRPTQANPTTLNQARAGVGGASWPLQLSLTQLPTGKVAGSYEDIITLEISPGT